MDCGKRYTAQSGRCMNDRFKEHKNLVRKTVVSSYLSLHCRSCVREPVNGECLLIKKENKLTREVIEAYEIYRDKDNYVSTPSVSLCKGQRAT